MRNMFSRRFNRPLVSLIVAGVIAAVAAAAGCEREEFVPLPTTAPSASSRVPATRRALPTSDEVFGSRSSTAPTTIAATETTTRPTDPPGGSGAAAADPSNTPDQAVNRLFELMQKQDVSGVRAMLADPPPLDRLRSEVALVAERIDRGATWAIVHSRTEGVAAVVIFRTRFPDGREEFTPLPLVNRYDRWRVLMGALNPKKLSPGEVSSMNKLTGWTTERMNELRGVPTTTTTTTTTTPRS